MALKERMWDKMEQILTIHFYTSAGGNIRNMYISPEDGGQGMRFEAPNPEEAGKALQAYLEMRGNQANNK